MTPATEHVLGGMASPSMGFPRRFLTVVCALGIVLAAAPLLATTGYIVDAQSGQDLEHTNNTKLWYAHGRWWGMAQDTSDDDWFLYVNDGPLPAAPGLQGGWTRTPVNVDNRNSTRIDLWYNETEDVVHVLRMHGSGGTYNEYVWDVGLDRYVIDNVLGDVSLPAAIRQASPCLAVDSTGQAFVAHDTAGVVTLEYSTDPGRSLWASLTLAGGAPDGDLTRAALMPFTDSVDGPRMGLLYFSAPDTLTFLEHDDDAGDTATDWTSEIVDPSTSADDHVSLRSNSQTGDVFAVVRTTPGAVDYYYRPDGGSWSPATTLFLDDDIATRPQLLVEEDNNEVYVFWTDREDDTIVYRRTPAGTIDFSVSLEAIGNINIDEFDDVQAPKLGTTCATGLMVLASTSGGTWYNPLPILWYRDVDGDQYGDTVDSVEACSPPVGYVRRPGDCDETDTAVNPGATEVCDGEDNNCNGIVDDAGSTYYRDADSDGYGDPNDSQTACTQPIGYILDSSDCDDSDPAINLDANEVCDGVDNDCDGTVDEEDEFPPHVPWYLDMDGDGFGDLIDFVMTCAQPPGYVLNPDDCDDTDPAINPNAVEVPDGVDNNCDGMVDNLPQPTGYILAPESGQDLAHSNNTKLWHGHGRWWSIAQDTSNDDWFIFENNGAVPQDQGVQGGWSQTPGNVDTRNSTRIDLWHNVAEDIVHVLRMHGTGGTYNEYIWDVGLDRYVLDATLGDVSLPGATSGANPSIAVDSTGQAFVARDSGGEVTLDYTTDAARSVWSSVTLATGAPGGGSTRASLMPFTDPVDGGQMGLLFFSDVNTLTFLKHDDDAADTAIDWTSEMLDAATTADDHVCLRASSQTGDLFAVVRTNPGDVDFFRRPAGGVWSAKTTLGSGVLVATRPQIAVDEDNNEVYVFWTDRTEDTIVYRRSPADAINFDPQVDVIAYPGLDWFNDVQAPKLGVTRGSDLMIVADGNDATWYNRLEVGDIRIEFADEVSIAWAGGRSGATSWNVYRGDLGVLKQGNVYTQLPGSNPNAAAFCGLSSPDILDAYVPAPGEVAFYLATGVVGGVESNLGVDGDGEVRPNANPCP